MVDNLICVNGVSCKVSKDDVQNNESKKDCRVSLSDFLNRKLNRNSVPPKFQTVQVLFLTLSLVTERVLRNNKGGKKMRTGYLVFPFKDRELENCFGNSILVDVINDCIRWSL